MKDLSDSVSGSTELVFPDDADDETYRLQERTVYDAEEVRDELDGDVPQYGSWLPVEIASSGDEDAWLVAPSQLRAALVEDDIRTGEPFHIKRMEKEGLDQAAPYEVTISYPEREDGAGRQSGIPSQ